MAPQTQENSKEGEEKPTHFERDDNRWRPRLWLRDWLILFSLIAFYLIWSGIVYLLEPGIR